MAVKRTEIYDLAGGDTTIVLGQVSRSQLITIEGASDSLTGALDMVVTIQQSNADNWVDIDTFGRKLQATYTGANDTKQFITNIQSAANIAAKIEVNGVTGGDIQFTLNS